MEGRQKCCVSNLAYLRSTGSPPPPCLGWRREKVEVKKHLEGKARRKENPAWRRSYRHYFPAGWGKWMGWMKHLGATFVNLGKNIWASKIVLTGTELRPLGSTHTLEIRKNEHRPTTVNHVLPCPRPCSLLWIFGKYLSQRRNRTFGDDGSPLDKFEYWYRTTPNMFSF